MPRSIRKSRATRNRDRRPRWTREEISVLRRLYRTHSNATIAGILGRKVSSIVFKGYRLGLSKGARRLRKMGQENIRRRWKPLKQSLARKARASRR